MAPCSRGPMMRCFFLCFLCLLICLLVSVCSILSLSGILPTTESCKTALVPPSPSPSCISNFDLFLRPLLVNLYYISTTWILSLSYHVLPISLNFSPFLSWSSLLYLSRRPISLHLPSQRSSVCLTGRNLFPVRVNMFIACCRCEQASRNFDNCTSCHPYNIQYN